MSEKEPVGRSPDRLCADKSHPLEQAKITWLQRCAESVHILSVVSFGRVGRITATQIVDGIWLTSHHHLRELLAADFSIESALAQCTIQTDPPINLHLAGYARWYLPHERASIYQPWEDFLVIKPQRSAGTPLPEEALTTKEYQMNESFPCALIAYPEEHDPARGSVISTGEGVYFGSSVIAELKASEGCSGGPIFDLQNERFVGILAREDRYVKGVFWGPSIDMIRPFLQQL